MAQCEALTAVKEEEPLLEDGTLIAEVPDEKGLAWAYKAIPGVDMFDSIILYHSYRLQAYIKHDETLSTITEPYFAGEQPVSARTDVVRCRQEPCTESNPPTAADPRMIVVTVCCRKLPRRH